MDSGQFSGGRHIARFSKVHHLPALFIALCALAPLRDTSSGGGSSVTGSLFTEVYFLLPCTRASTTKTSCKSMFTRYLSDNGGTFNNLVSVSHAPPAVSAFISSIVSAFDIEEIILS
jgi:hypothetical protein